MFDDTLNVLSGLIFLYIGIRIFYASYKQEKLEIINLERKTENIVVLSFLLLAGFYNVFKMFQNIKFYTIVIAMPQTVGLFLMFFAILKELRKK
jgi:hypothetical protein